MREATFQARHRLCHSRHGHPPFFATDRATRGALMRMRLVLPLRVARFRRCEVRFQACSSPESKVRFGLPFPYIRESPGEGREESREICVRNPRTCDRSRGHEITRQSSVSHALIGRRHAGSARLHRRTRTLTAIHSRQQPVTFRRKHLFKGVDAGRPQHHSATLARHLGRQREHTRKSARPKRTHH